MAKNILARAWSFVVYPESAPENWRQILDDLHCAWVESPLHEFDVNDTGEVKKPHWHVIIVFEGKKSYSQMLEFLAPLNCPHPQVCHSIRGYVRYFCHLDNPEKYQYNPALIIGHGGFNPEEYLKLSASARYSMLRDMIEYIREKDICDFMEFMEYAMEEKYETWFPLLCDNSTYMIRSVIQANAEFKKAYKERYEQ